MKNNQGCDAGSRHTGFNRSAGSRGKMGRRQRLASSIGTGPFILQDLFIMIQLRWSGILNTGDTMSKILKTSCPIYNTLKIHIIPEKSSSNRSSARR